MAERRMFTRKVTDSDEFISMSSSSQALYLHLCQGSDDDGFNNQVHMAMFKAHASVDDLKVLLAKRFILQFDNGVIVIKHWRMANAIRKDRYVPTNFQEELARLRIKENGSYTECGCQTVANWLPNGCQTVAVGKDSIGEDSIGKDSIEKEPAKRFTPPTLEEVKAYCQEKGYTFSPENFIAYYNSNGWLVGGRSKMKDWHAACATWQSRERTQKKQKSAPFKSENDNGIDLDQFLQENSII